MCGNYSSAETLWGNMVHTFFSLSFKRICMQSKDVILLGWRWTKDPIKVIWILQIEKNSVIFHYQVHTTNVAPSIVVLNGPCPVKVAQSRKIFSIWSQSQKNMRNHCPSTLNQPWKVEGKQIEIIHRLFLKVS